jgi:hypothetical protein
MTEIYNIFVNIVEQYGVVTGVIAALTAGLIFCIWKLLKNSSSTITKYIEKKMLSSDQNHKKALAYRKTITPEVRDELADLAKKLNVDRTMLLEYSNGSQNLVGLPFLFLNATSEFVKPGVCSVSSKYQRTNTSIFASVIEDMERMGYLFVENVEDIKEKYPILYGMMKCDKISSIILYPLYGMDNSLGFIEIMDKETINKNEAVPILSNSAQKISSLLNYDEIKHESR